jgi:hypothetical protein
MVETEPSPRLNRANLEEMEIPDKAAVALEAVTGLFNRMSISRRQ